MMRLLKPIWTVVVAGAVSLGAAGLAAQAKQPAPSKTPPAKKTTPTAQAPAPAKTMSAPAKTAPPKSAPGQAAKTQAPPKARAAAPSGAAPAASTGESDLKPGNRRDPFESLIAGRGPREGQTAEVTCRAPGKGGIVIDTMRLEGVVRSAQAVIAIVKTPQQRVYFLRDGDRLCDGRVEKISMDGMTLRQQSRDAFGKPIERPVSKRLFPSAGE